MRLGCRGVAGLIGVVDHRRLRVWACGIQEKPFELELEPGIQSVRVRVIRKG